MKPSTPDDITPAELERFNKLLYPMGKSSIEALKNENIKITNSCTERRNAIYTVTNLYERRNAISEISQEILDKMAVSIFKNSKTKKTSSAKDNNSSKGRNI